MSGYMQSLALGAGVLAIAALPGSAASQVERPWEVGGGPSFEQYAFSDPQQVGLHRISLFALPFGAGARVVDGVHLSVRAAWARGEVTRSSGEALALSGLTDTEVRLSWLARGGAVRIEVAGYAPTGAATHDAGEAVVAGIVAADLLPMRISHWGIGGGLATSASVAQNWGRFGLGASASYRISREFEPAEGENFRYQPGNEAMVRVAADLSVTERSKLSLSVGVRQFGEDVGNDANLFQTGDRVEALTAYSFPVGLRSAGAVYGSVIRREQGRFLLAGGPDVPSQNLIIAGGLVRLPVGTAFFTPRVDARLFRPAEGAGQGYVVGAGASFEVPLGPSITLLPSGTARIGSVDLLSSESGFNGWQAAVTVRFTPRTR